MATKNIVPRSDSEGQLGTSSKYWLSAFLDGLNLGNAAASNLVFTPSTGDTVTFAAGTNGTLTITTVDTAAAAANVGFVVDGTFDIDAASTIIVDGTGVSIDGTLDSNLTVTGSDKDLTLSVVGGGTQKLILSSAGTGADAISITSSAGGIDILASGAAAGEDIDILATGSSVNITSTENNAGALVLNALGGLASTITLNSSGNSGSLIINNTSDYPYIRLQNDGTGLWGLGTVANANTTDFQFYALTSGANNLAASLTTAGLLTIDDDLIIKTGGTIGGASDPDLLTLAANSLTVAGAGTFTGQVNVNNGSINFGSGQNSTISVSQANGSTAGRNIEIRAGNATTGTTTNLKGGDIDIRSGTAAGTGHTKIDFNATLIGNSNGAITKIASISDYYAVEGGATSSGVGAVNNHHNAGGRLNIHTGSNLVFPRAASNTTPVVIYVESTIADGSSTYTGSLLLQAGGNGSASYGAGLRLYGHAHTSKPGSAEVGLSAGVASEFTVNNSGAGGGTDLFKVQRSNSNVTIGGGNLVIGTAGKGIDFGAETPSASGRDSNAGGAGNILDDYEEGSWTAAIRGSGDQGTYALASSPCTYTKVGRVVTLNAAITLSGSGQTGGSGYIQITGLPFVKMAGSLPVGALYVATSIDFTGSSTFAVVLPISNNETSILYLAGCKSAGGTTNIPIASLGVNDSFAFEITYQTNT